MIIGRAARIG